MAHPLCGRLFALAKRSSLHIETHTRYFNNQVKNARPGESLSPYCVVRVGGVEVGRTTTIANSSEPLWATEFDLPDELLLGASPLLKNARKVVGGGRRMELTPPQPSPGVVALEVWDSVPEGNPVLLGAVEVPSNVLQEVLSPSPHRGQEARRIRTVRSETEDGDDDKRRETEGSCGSSDLRLLNLNLRPRQKGRQPQNQQLAMVAAKAAGGAMVEAEYSGAVGVLSFSLKRVVSDAEQSRHNHPQAIAEDGPRQDFFAEENGDVAGLGKGVIGTRTTEVSANTIAAALLVLVARCCTGRGDRCNEQIDPFSNLLHHPTTYQHARGTTSV